LDRRPTRQSTHDQRTYLRHEMGWPIDRDDLEELSRSIQAID
jgi:hypothetical protein